ncbi:hypothetical protein K466DRAFT_20730 [Polyporus arcularius HHB13444]|uniref:Uncharacterized protein n=1 Tax=Polyporus arcularius HHB13444 TaxID=1314778 RepID=A0A5C3NRJ1_9APHY|nr:hypothetical protein K466DRAFT_20730 [Polyporus arcularius HHB13444]
MKREASKVRTPPITDCVYTVREGPIVMQTAVTESATAYNGHVHIKALGFPPSAARVLEVSE